MKIMSNVMKQKTKNDLDRAIQGLKQRRRLCNKIKATESEQAQGSATALLTRGYRLQFDAAGHFISWYSPATNFTMGTLDEFFQELDQSSKNPRKAT